MMTSGPAATSSRAWDERRMWFRSFARAVKLTKGAAASPARISLAANPDRPVINSAGAIRGSRERGAWSTPRAGEFIEERDVVGAFRRLAHHFVDLISVRPHENAPTIGLDAVEDDGRGLCRTGQRLIAKTPLELGHEVAQLLIRQLRDVAAQQSKSLSRLRETGSIDCVSPRSDCRTTIAPGYGSQTSRIASLRGMKKGPVGYTMSCFAPGGHWRYWQMRPASRRFGRHSNLHCLGSELSRSRGRKSPMSRRGRTVPCPRSRDRA